MTFIYGLWRLCGGYNNNLFYNLDNSLDNRLLLSPRIFFARTESSILNAAQTYFSKSKKKVTGSSYMYVISDR